MNFVLKLIKYTEIQFQFVILTLRKNNLDIRLIIRIDVLISREMTGSPKKLASKLAITERSVYNYIAFMKQELKAPISYDYNKLSYVYTEEWEFKFNNK